VGDGYRTYAHLADVVSLNVLRGMVTDQNDMPGLDQSAFERTRAAYLIPCDLKKIDVGGGLIHGDARDFREDASTRILLAHRATELTLEEKEIGSSAAFGTVDVLIAGQSDGLRRQAFPIWRQTFRVCLSMICGCWLTILLRRLIPVPSSLRKARGPGRCCCY